VRGIEQLIAQRGGQLLLAPERVLLLVLFAQRPEPLAARLQGPRLFDNDRGLEKGLDNVGRWRHDTGNEVLAGADALIDGAVDPAPLHADQPGAHEQHAPGRPPPPAPQENDRNPKRPPATTDAFCVGYPLHVTLEVCMNYSCSRFFGTGETDNNEV